MNGAVGGCGLVSVWPFAFRATPRRHFTARTSQPLFPRTKTFYPFVARRPWAIDTVSTAPRMNLCFLEKCLLSMAEANVCPITGLGCIFRPQHFFRKWPIRMSNGGHSTCSHTRAWIGIHCGLILFSMTHINVTQQTSFQVLHRLEERPGQLLWHRPGRGNHLH